jgi:hypothetical protein
MSLQSEFESCRLIGPRLHLEGGSPSDSIEATEIVCWIADGLLPKPGFPGPCGAGCKPSPTAGIDWLGREGSNLRMAESKSAALPLGYAPTDRSGTARLLPRRERPSATPVYRGRRSNSTRLRPTKAGFGASRGYGGRGPPMSDGEGSPALYIRDVLLAHPSRRRGGCHRARVRATRGRLLPLPARRPLRPARFRDTAAYRLSSLLTVPAEYLP